MFSRLDDDKNEWLSALEFKEAWEWFAGWDCQNFDPYGSEAPGGEG